MRLNRPGETNALIRLRLALRGTLREYAFHRSEIRIGRSPLNDLSIPMEGVSVRHGCLRLRGTQWFYEDCDSLHGSTLIRAKAREPLEGERSVREGDILELGGLVQVKLLSTTDSLALGDTLVHCPFEDDQPLDGLDVDLMRQTAALAMKIAAKPTPSALVSGASALVASIAGHAPSTSGFLRHGRGPARYRVLDDEGKLTAGKLGLTMVDRDRLLGMVQSPGLIHHPTATGTRVIVAAFDEPDPHASALVFELTPALDEAALTALVTLGHTLVPLLHSIARARNLRDGIESIRAENRYFRERQRRHYLFKELVTESASMREVYTRLNQLVEHPDPVLLVGEAGSGKELIARAVHHLGERSGSLMVTRRCADEDPTLLDLELFGAGARGQVAQLGILELANGGTVFLNQIERLPLLLQSKLLRVIKEGELRRHGEEMARSVNVRLVLSTHQDLGQLVSEGIFRKDLHMALRDSVLRVPPLRERKDDLLPLVQIFLGVFSRRYGVPIPRVNDGVEARLKLHTWPGNVRELQSAVESAVLKHTGGVVTAEDFGF